MRIVCVVLAAVLLAGCAQVWSGIERAKERVGEIAARVVDEYCAAPEDSRLMLRAEVADAIAPHAIRIDCE